MKLSQYNLVIEPENEVIVYNLKNLNGFKVKKDSDEYEQILKIFNPEEELVIDDMVSALYNKGFIVGDNVDEFEEVKQKVNKILNAEKRYIEIFLHVTNNCNFKCVYCFKEANIEYFSDDNWNKLFKFIKQQFDMDKLDKVKLYFYGGEPLLRVNEIINFMSKTNDMCKNYEGKIIEYLMISNGYLLTNDLYDKLSQLGLKFLQITLDGFAEQHNKTRPRVDGAGTWDKIVENLKYVNEIDDDVQIIIRTNFNDLNKNILFDFKKWLEETFTNKKFIFDFHPVIAITEHVDKNTTVDRYSKEVNDINDELKGEADFLMESLTQLTCNYASRHGHLTILPDGRVSQCLEAYNNTVVGYLGDGEIVYTVELDNWLNRFEEKDCKTCIAYPLCCARACVVEKKCNHIHNTLNMQIEKIKEGKIKLL